MLVKGRSNYLCQRRLEQTRGAAELCCSTTQRQLESLWTIEEWAHAHDRRLAGRPARRPRAATCGTRSAPSTATASARSASFYDNCFWQAAKRRMQGGNILVVNHALFFRDLALRMAGVNYLPKYDAVILDEAHTVEDVAGDHFGLKVSEGGIRYQLRHLYDPKQRQGHAQHARLAPPTTRSATSSSCTTAWRTSSTAASPGSEQHGRGNGRDPRAELGRERPLAQAARPAPSTSRRC